MGIGSSNECFSSANAIKADFNSCYNAADPRSYFEVLGALDYVIPEIGGAVLLKLAEHLIRLKGRPITILDVGCSYGILSAVMRYGLSVEQLRSRYLTAPLHDLDAQHLADLDSLFLASWAPRDDLRFVGLDRSAEAIAYGLNVGLLDDGLVVDLEANSLNTRSRSAISNVDLIVSTGAVGYVTEKTFSELLGAFQAGQEPWIASFVLRMFDYREIAAEIGSRGLATERLEGRTFMQRRFRDCEEAEETLRLLRARGLDPAGKESEGAYHAELFVSRPQTDIERIDLREIILDADRVIVPRS